MNNTAGKVIAILPRPMFQHTKEGARQAEQNALNAAKAAAAKKHHTPANLDPTPAEAAEAAKTTSKTNANAPAAKPPTRPAWVNNAPTTNTTPPKKASVAAARATNPAAEAAKTTSKTNANAPARAVKITTTPPSQQTKANAPAAAAKANPFPSLQEAATAQDDRRKQIIQNKADEEARKAANAAKKASAAENARIMAKRREEIQNRMKSDPSLNPSDAAYPTLAQSAATPKVVTIDERKATNEGINLFPKPAEAARANNNPNSKKPQLTDAQKTAEAKAKAEKEAAKALEKKLKKAEQRREAQERDAAIKKEKAEAAEARRKHIEEQTAERERILATSKQREADAAAAEAEAAAAGGGAAANSNTHLTATQRKLLENLLKSVDIDTLKKIVTTLYSFQEVHNHFIRTFVELYSKDKEIRPLPGKWDRAAKKAGISENHYDILNTNIAFVKLLLDTSNTNPEILLPKNFAEPAPN
jgi:hypothetical protein